MEEMEHTDLGISGADAPEMFSSHPVAVTFLECGSPRDIDAFEGESLMPALKRAGLPLLAVCGGQGACGTCKVAFPPEWADRLPAPGKRGVRVLPPLKGAEGERLSCRILLSPALDGLEVDACE